MTEYRPRLNLPRSPLEITLEVVAACVIMFQLYLLLSTWNALPESVPIHFGFSGRPDGWGGKTMYVFLTLITLGLYAGLSVLNRFTHVYNYPWPITEKNVERQYGLARALVTLLKAVIVSFFAFIQWMSVQVALGQSEGLGEGSVLLFLGAVFGSIGFYFVQAYRHR